MEELASEEESATATGAGSAIRHMAATAGGSAEKVADGEHGGAAAGGGDTGRGNTGGGNIGRGNTGDAASVTADEVGALGRHGARTVARERIASRQENREGEPYGVGREDGGREAYGVASEPSGVGGDEGGREADRVAENPGGDRQGVGRGVELLQGIDTPRVEALPERDETPGVDTEGKIVMGEEQ